MLVGAPGSGKSTVGRIVAERLGTTYRDTDADVEASAGSSIGDLFLLEGEAGFRVRERTAVVAALAEHRGVLSLGGGAVLDAGTRADLHGRPVVHLEVGLAAAAARVGLNRDRPLLLGNVRGTMLRLLEERRPLYAEVASVVVPTDGRPPEDVADDVVAWVGARDAGAPA